MVQLLQPVELISLIYILKHWKKGMAIFYLFTFTISLIWFEDQLTLQIAVTDDRIIVLLIKFSANHHKLTTGK
jgi:hypothetical protein